MVKKHSTKKSNYIVAIYAAIFLMSTFVVFALLAPTKQDTTRLFWDTVNQNLKTSSVTKTITQVADDTKIEEKTDIQYRAQLVARKTTTVSRQSESAQSTVTTEKIGTVEADYIRYTKLFSSYHGGLDNQLNKWADDNDQDTKLATSLKDALLSTPLLFGYVSNTQRATLVSQLKNRNVYTVSDKEIKNIKTAQGIVAYDIPVNVNWNEYTDVYKQYLVMLGLSDLAKSIDGPTEPTTYNFVISINPSSKHIVALRLADPYVTQQTYDNYDTSVSIEIPTKTELTAKELETLVQEQVR